jgi:dCMP deaminase
MSDRLTWSEYACYLALAAESRSEDPHTQVGCCILNLDGRVLSTGYNGLKKGMKVEPWMSDPEQRVRKAKLFIHAESNALNLISNRDAPYILGCTWSPCGSCAQRIISTTIQKVYFITDYLKDQEYKDIFKFYSVHWEKLSEESLNRIEDRFKASFGKAKKLRWP